MSPVRPAPVFPYKLVATDLDGTLLRPDDTVSERTREALAAATAAGAAHIVVTGRSVAWTRHVLDDLGYEGIAVCGQGAQVYHAGEQRLLTSLTMDRRLAVLAIEKIEAAVWGEGGSQPMDTFTIVNEKHPEAEELGLIGHNDNAVAGMAFLGMDPEQLRKDLGLSAA